jgi:hypothetical protein
MIFISYPDEKSDIGGAIANFLAENIDIPPDEIKRSCLHRHSSGFGGSVSRQLKNDINYCSVIVAILSRDNVKNGWVTFELGAAWALGKKIFLLMPDVDMSDFPDPLNDYFSINVGSKDVYIRLMDMVREITGFLNLSEKKNPHVFASLERTIGALRHKKPGAKNNAAEEDDWSEDEWAAVTEATRPKPPVKVAAKKEVKKGEKNYCDIICMAAGQLRQESVTVRASWDDIYKTIAPHLHSPQEDAYIKKLILGLCKERDPHFGHNIDYRVLVNPTVDASCYAKIMNHFEFHDCVRATRAPHSVFQSRDDRDMSHWTLTAHGIDQLRDVIARLKALKR